jgi:hypothetical protein
VSNFACRAARTPEQLSSKYQPGPNALGQFQIRNIVNSGRCPPSMFSKDTEIGVIVDDNELPEPL